MIETVRLRFRDITGNDTITEHARLISSTGHCWWGWWRKASESPAEDDLAELEGRMVSGPIEIGLFDRSDPSRFFRATATACHWRRDTTVPSPEPENTPLYYRDASVAAWFRLTNITPIKRDEFDRRFGGIPLGHLTFFPVRSGTQFQLVDTSLIPLTETEMRGNTILHLSDLHCGADFRFKPSLIPSASLTDILLTDLRRLAHDEGIEVGLIVVSGDLTTKADPYPLNTNDPSGYGPSALSLLGTITDGLRLSEKNVVIVPGNHDIPLREFSPTDYSHENGFKFFLSHFYGRRINEFMQFWRFFRKDETDLEILAINSAKLRDASLKNYGFVRWAPYDDFMRQVGRRSKSTLRIAVLHHHLVPAPRQETVDSSYPEAGISVTLDTGTIIQGLQAHGFQVALHGHQHVPAITTVARGRRQNGPDVAGLDTALHIISGGSAGAVSQRLNSELSDNSYGLLTLGPGSVRVRVRRYNESLEPEDYMRTTISL